MVDFLDEIWERTKGSLSDDDLKRIERGPAQVQSEPVTSVTAPAKVEAIEYSPEYKSQLPQTEILRENLNRAIDRRAADSAALSANAQDLFEARQAQEKEYADTLSRFRAPSAGYARDPDLEKQLSIARSRELEKAPERDLLSELIVSFAPAALGLFGGSTGAIAGAKAAPGIRQTYEARRKEDIEGVSQRNKLAQDKYEKLLKIDKDAAEMFMQKQKLETDRLKAEVDAKQFGLGLTQKDLQQAQSLASQASSDVLGATARGAQQVAELETIPMKEAGKQRRATTIATGQSLKDATNLRKEFESYPDVKNYRTMQENFNKIEASYENPSPAGDIAMIFSYMKMLDPGSTVREGEYATAQNAAGIPTKIRNAWNKAVDGTFLSEGQRRDFYSQARNQFNAQQKMVASRESDIGALAGAYGADSANVLPSRSAPKPKALSPKDKQAVKWAKENPKDPRSKVILERNGM